MLGEKLADQELPEPPAGHVSVKEAVLPFARFAGADSVLGPEMKSTGEVMGIAADFPTAFGKAQAAAGVSLPTEGAVFITVTDTDKPAATQIAARFHDLGFELIATGGTAQAISAMGVPVTPINKIAEGSPHVVDLIRERRCDLVINTPTGSGARADGYEIRTAAVRHGIPCVTTMTGASAAVRAIAARSEGDAEVRSLQEIHGPRPAPSGRRALDDRAPFGRRLCEVTESRASGGYRLFSLLDARGPRARSRASSTCSPRERHWEQRGSAPSCPGPSRSPSRARPTSGVRLDFLIEGIGPGTDRLCELEPGERVWVNGPLGNSFSDAAASSPPGAAGAILVGGGIGIAPLALLRRSFAASEHPHPRPARLPRREPTPAASTTSSPAARSRLASDDGHIGHHGYVTDLLAAMLEGDDAASAAVYACGPPQMLEAVRRCAPSAASPASSRWSRRWPAATAPASAAPCPRPAAATCASASTARWSAATIETVGRGQVTHALSFCGIELEHPVINASGTFDAIAARRVYGDALLEASPSPPSSRRRSRRSRGPATSRSGSGRRRRG